MIYFLLSKLDTLFKFNTAKAHCDVPCGIYDPIKAQLSALSVLRFLDQINELEDNAQLSLAQAAKLSRLVSEKESHAEEAKHEVRVIWGDYMKGPQFEQFPNMHTLVHDIMMAGSSCKQHIDRANGEKLLSLINEFAAAFWATKGVETYEAVSPYPPAEKLVYPVVK